MNLLRHALATAAHGEDTTDEMRRLGMEHADRLLQELDLLTRALDINRQGRERFAAYMPRQAQHAGQAATPSLADQRRAISQVKKVEHEQERQERQERSQA